MTSSVLPHELSLNVESFCPAQSAHFHKILSKIVRKFRLNQRQISQTEKKLLQSTFFKPGKPSITTLSSLNQFLKRKLEQKRLINFVTDQKAEELAGISKLVKPQQIEILQKQEESYFLKGYAREQNEHEICHPLLISYLQNNIIVKELAESICALANQPDGGHLLICQQHSNSTILNGLRNFNQKDSSIFRQKISVALKCIAFHQNILIKVQRLPIYSNLVEKIQGKKSEQFVLKIEVFPKQCTNRLFYIESQNNTIQPPFTFCTISKNFKSDSNKFYVSKVQACQIYSLMRKVAINRLKASQKISKSKNLEKRLEFNLLKFILETKRKSILLPNDSYQNFVFLLNRISKSGQDTIHHQFQNIQANQTIVQLKVSVEFGFLDTIQRIKMLLIQTNTKFRLIIPFAKLQKEFNKYQKSVGSSIPTYVICYFVLEESFQRFRNRVQQFFGHKYDYRVTMNEVTENITISISMSAEEIQACQLFLWKTYHFVPETKKYVYQYKSLGSQNNQLFKPVQFRFSRTHISAAAFTLFLLTLARKRSY